jgi:hypothetical protein
MLGGSAEISSYNFVIVKPPRACPGVGWRGAEASSRKGAYDGSTTRGRAHVALVEALPFYGVLLA